MTIQQNQLRKKTSKKSLNTSKNVLENQKKPWLLTIILSMPLKKRKNMILIKL